MKTTMKTDPAGNESGHIAQSRTRAAARRFFAAAGAALCSAVLASGCSSVPELSYDAQNPAVRVSATSVYFAGRPMRPEEVPERFDSYGVPRDSTIHIRLDPEVKNLQRARLLMAHLRRAGYTRPVLVTSRHAESINLGKKKKKAATATGKASPRETRKPRKIRYKRADDAGGW